MPRIFVSSVLDAPAEEHERQLVELMNRNFLAGLRSLAGRLISWPKNRLYSASSSPRYSSQEIW